MNKRNLYIGGAVVAVAVLGRIFTKIFIWRLNGTSILVQSKLIKECH
jgi:hypothetical protein